MQGTYDAGLVTLSIVVAVMASYVALDLAARVTASLGTRPARYWLIGGAFSMGAGIWSMHFIGMLAFELPMPMSYDIPITAASMFIAVVASAFALHIASSGQLGARRLAGAGTLLGFGIAAMHYTGMAAMQMTPPIRYAPGYVLLSVAIAIGASIAALWIAFRLREHGSFAQKSGAALVMGAAIAGMHYTGMVAADFAPHSVPLHVQHIDNDWLALAIAVVAFVIFGITLFVSIFDSRLAVHAETLRRTNEELRESEERFRATFEQAAVGIAHTTFDRRYLVVNQKFCDMLGYTREELLTMTSDQIALPDDQEVSLDNRRALAGEIDTYAGEKRYICKDGSLLWVCRTVSLARDSAGKPLYFIRVIQDITERKRAEERLEQLAQYDALTGLPNRTLFRDRLAAAMTRAERSKSMVAVMFIDMDRFKAVNDTLGHKAGDTVLQVVAGRLRDVLRKVDTVARLGGDEFTILIENIVHVDEVSQVADRIKKAFVAPIVIGERELFMTPSLGITLYPLDSDELDTLLQTADAAMYHAKKMGRNKYEFYAPEMNARAGERLKMEGLLRRALERREFVLHYQPKVETESGKVVGVEALLRWSSGELGPVAPARFIPLAEETGLIEAIGEWVLRTACADSRSWQDAGYAPLTMAVNLSPRQLRQDALVETIGAVLRETGLPANLLELEITETTIMENMEKNSGVLRAIRSLGASLALDDFGTGYSSLGYLTKLPVQTLKIDRSFVATMHDNREAMTLVSTILTLAATLGLKVVAEGVETEAQMKLLRLLRCHQIQGYFISRPVPASGLLALLEQPRGAEPSAKPQARRSRTEPAYAGRATGRRHH